MQILSIISPTKTSEIMCVPQLWAVMAGWFCGQMCLEQIWHVFFSQGLQFFTYLRIGSNFSVQTSPVLWYKVSPHKISTKAGGLKVFRTDFPQIL